MPPEITPNPQPTPGGIANFQTDTDPGPPTDSTPIHFTAFNVFSTGMAAMKLTWTLDAPDTSSYDYKVESRTGSASWAELTRLENKGLSESCDDFGVGPGEIYHYRVTALSAGVVLCTSHEVACDVSFPITIDVPIDEDDNRKYKIAISNPPIRDLNLEWREFYTEGYSENENKLANLKHAGTARNWSISGAMESQEFTADIPNNVGCYTLSCMPKISLQLDNGKANLKGIACPESESQVPMLFEVNDSGLPGTKYTLSWSGSNTLRVTAGGRDISNPLTFTREELLSSYKYFAVGAGPLAQDGDFITVNLQSVAPDEDQTSLGTDSHTFRFSAQNHDFASLTIPIDEASGAKYRKIALTGRPLKDEKPQATAENDQQAEETFVDALTLGLRHNTTDAWLPVANSELAMSVRRNSVSDVWNNRFGLRPHERPDLPFGTGWSSNLAANVKIVRPTNDADYAYVTDENGAVYRYAIWQDKFFPFPTAQHEQNTYLTSLEARGDKLIFTRKFGSVLEYERTTIHYVISKDRLEGSKHSEDITYYRLVKITDRTGQVVTLEYDNNAGQLVPMMVHAEGREDQTLYIQMNNEGLVTAIWDANWNQTTYSYTHDESRNLYLLEKVTAPEGAETVYGYSFAEEADQTPKQGPSTYTHCDVNRITDPNGKVYAFDYMLNHDGTNTAGASLGKYNYYWDSELSHGIYYIATGEGRMVKKITLPDNLGVVDFENYSLTKLLGGDEEQATLSTDSMRKTRVRDVQGNWRAYQWNEGAVYNVRTLSNYYSGKSITNPKIIYYRQMNVTHEGFGIESYQFDVNAGLNISKVTDFSGNVTDYEYKDVWTGERADNYHTIIPTGDGINGRYEDPTAETRYLPDQGTVRKEFAYEAQHRVMSKVVDALGNSTGYTIDTLGRRTEEQCYKNVYGYYYDQLQQLWLWGYYNEEIQHTLFQYSSVFPGFMTRKTIQNISYQSGATDLVTAYEPDAAGRIAREIVNPDQINSETPLVTLHVYDKQGNKIQSTDPNGNSIWFSYDKRNRLVKVLYADDSYKSYGYDARGNKVEERDENGNYNTYSYDACNRLIEQRREMMPRINGQVRDTSQDLVTTFTYNAAGSKLSQTDANGNVTHFEYDGLQRLVKTIDASGGITTLEYGTNSGGSTFDVVTFKPTRTTDPLGYFTEVDYDTLYRPVRTRAQYQKSPFASLYAETQMEYDKNGNQIAVTDPLGNKTQTQFDALNRPVQINNPDYTYQYIEYISNGLKYSVQNENYQTTSTEYDPAGRPAKVIPPYLYDENGQRKSPITYTKYDGAGNVIKTINPLSKEWNFAYDVRNRKVSETQPAVIDAVDGQSKHPVLHTEYDNVGNVTKQTDARGNSTLREYDRANRPVRVTDARNGVTLTEYDRNGNITKVTDANGHATRNEYDTLNRLVKTTDAENVTVSYTYDRVGNRLSVTDGNGHVTGFTYDGLKRNLSETDSLGKTTLFTYNAVNKTRRTDAKSQVTDYTYDTCNRLQSISYTGRSQDNQQYSYDYMGNLKYAYTNYSSYNRYYVYNAYDNLNRVTEESSGQKQHVYQYDLAGNRLNTKYGSTDNSYTTSTTPLREIRSTYDDLNRLSTLTENGRVTKYGYDLNGNIVRLELPNGDVTVNQYDELNRCMSKITTDKNNAVISKYAQEYDAVGNVVKITEQYAGNEQRQIVNGYDKIYRLLSESISGGTNRQTTYDYDRANNRVRKSANGAVTAYTYNQANQLTACYGARVAGFEYDANGNRMHRYGNPPPLDDGYLLAQNGLNLATQNGNLLIVSRAPSLTDYLVAENGDYLTAENADRLILETGTPEVEAEANYEYDYENRLVKVTTNGHVYQYGYDYRTRRVYRNEGNGDETVSFSGGTSVSEWGSTGSTPIVEYVRGSDYGGGIGGILYTYRNGVPSYTHYDARGDVTQKTDSSGSVTYQAQYEAFGTRTREDGSTQDRQKASTKEEDPTGLLNEGFRYRDLQTGSFITKDPAGFIDGPNLYTYVNQNPWSKFDPEGLFAPVVGAGIAAGTDIIVQLAFNHGDYKNINWKSVAVSAAVGATVVGVEAAITRSVASASLKAVATGVAVKVSVNSAISGAGQVSLNAWEGKPLTDNLGQTMVLSGLGTGLGIKAKEIGNNLAAKASQKAFENAAGDLKLLSVSNAIQIQPGTSIYTLMGNSMAFSISTGQPFLEKGLDLENSTFKYEYKNEEFISAESIYRQSYFQIQYSTPNFNLEFSWARNKEIQKPPIKENKSEELDNESKKLKDIQKQSPVSEPYKDLSNYA